MFAGAVFYNIIATFTVIRYELYYLYPVLASNTNVNP